ncbi:MAG: recombination regulator RecX, partial [Bacteroidetes bacterium]|nr:recombination regulator RecX [Bacteroidota bacterium]
MNKEQLKSALNSARNLCSRSEKCKSEIRQKLVEWGIPEEKTETLLVQLEKEEFIDELRYARAYANDKFRFGKWGKIKISYALRQKRIPEPVISDAVENINAEEYSRVLKEELQKKLRTTSGRNKYE